VSQEKKGVVLGEITHEIWIMCVSFKQDIPKDDYEMGRLRNHLMNIVRWHHQLCPVKPIAADRLMPSKQMLLFSRAYSVNIEQHFTG